VLAYIALMPKSTSLREGWRKGERGVGGEGREPSKDMKRKTVTCRQWARNLDKAVADNQACKGTFLGDRATSEFKGRCAWSSMHPCCRPDKPPRRPGHAHQTREQQTILGQGGGEGRGRRSGCNLCTHCSRAGKPLWSGVRVVIVQNTLRVFPHGRERR